MTTKDKLNFMLREVLFEEMKKDEGKPNGRYDRPYLVPVDKDFYNQLKKEKVINEDDICMCNSGWTKVIKIGS